MKKRAIRQDARCHHQNVIVRKKARTGHEPQTIRDAAHPGYPGLPGAKVFAVAFPKKEIEHSFSPIVRIARTLE
ncbi:MAG TPA: hypothetical protein VLG14_11115 [Sphingomonas sp.]|jgi:hypothetical protein|nr:hypothetical protein [Sphingomonas sp.]